jgi:hypothetical protein
MTVVKHHCMEMQQIHQLCSSLKMYNQHYLKDMILIFVINQINH